MNTEDLLKMLRDGGLDDEAIKNLLSETLAALEPKEDVMEEGNEDENAEKASKLLGVNF